MNSFLDNLENENNFTLTENGAVTHKTTKSAILDMFSLGAAYRNRNDADCILLFKNALEENEALAMKCLFYLRDIRGGQGERRFFRVCFKWLCDNNPEAAKRNLEYLSEYGRWDDLVYATAGTKLEDYALFLIKEQLVLDMESKTPSLLAKWLPSENASSHKTRKMAIKVRTYLKMTHKEYRKALAELRKRINIVERLMSENRWDEIEFDKIPSKAGLIYKNAFSRRDILKEKYTHFIKDETTKVNASVLYPYDVAHRAFNCYDRDYNSVDRMAIQKYWDALPDIYEGKQENGLAIVDVSGSMSGQPLEVAVSLGAYIAERGHGPFANHFITFSSRPQLVKFEGVDITDKLQRARNADWEMDTNLEAVFDMMLKIAKREDTKPEDIPERLYILSDMEFNNCISDFDNGWRNDTTEDNVETLLERIAKEWAAEGYKLPQVIFWNLDCRQNNIPALGGRFGYVSGFSPVILKNILTGRDGYDLMLDKLLSDRYAVIK